MTTLAEVAASRARPPNGEATPSNIVSEYGWPTPERVESLHVEHPELFFWDSDDLGLRLLFRPAKSAEYHQYMDEMGKAQIYVAERQLCFACVVHPERQVLGKLFERFPGICDPLADAIVKVAGRDRKALVGKL